MGGNGSGGEGDVDDGATCAHHAIANIGEEGRKAIDRGLKAKMNITDEQAETDAAKMKCLRTSVGWFSSPVCSLIYQVCAREWHGCGRIHGYTCNTDFLVVCATLVYVQYCCIRKYPVSEVSTLHQSEYPKVSELMLPDSPRNPQVGAKNA